MASRAVEGDLDRGPRFESLRFEAVSHHYEPRSGDRVATLDRISFEVGANEFVTILGPSGCGKSTIFNLATGLLRPRSGAVVVNDQPLMRNNPYVAYMFQRDNLLEWRTVVDNAALGQEFLGVPRRQARAAAEAELARFGLRGFEARHPYELSGGMRQRVALLRTYLTNRDLLLLDEPFGSLDALTRLQMQQFLLERWEQDHRTVLFITHDVDEALLLGDRVIVLTARPARVKAEIQVELGRPRGTDVTTTAQFIDLKKRVLALVHAEADVA